MFKRFVFLILLLLIAPVAAQAEEENRSLKVTDAVVNIYLEEDGSLLVEEEMFYTFEGEYDKAYRDIPVEDNQFVEILSVSDGQGREYKEGGEMALEENGEIYTYGSGYTDDARRVVWHFDLADDQEWFKIRYRIRGAVTAYDDIIDLNYDVWNSGWDFSLDQLDAYFYHPNVSPKNPLYKMFSYPPGQKVEMKKLEDIAFLKADDIPSNQNLRLRVTLPREVLLTPDAAFTPIVPTKGMPDVLAENREIIAEYNSTENVIKRNIYDNIVLYSLGLLVIILGWLFLFLWLATQGSGRVTRSPKYLSTPPDDASPLEAQALIQRGKYNSNAILATFFNLARKGMYESRLDSERSMIFSVAADRPNFSRRPYEHKTIAFFDSLLNNVKGEEKQASLQEMIQRAKDNRSQFGGKWRSLNESYSKEAKSVIEYKNGFLYKFYLLGLYLGMLAAGVLTYAAFGLDKPFDPGGGAWFLLPLFILMLFAVISEIPSNYFKRISDKCLERTESWKSFQRWAEDFPRLKDAEIPSYKLWPGIMEYAIAFGTAERIAKTGKIPLGFSSDDTKSDDAFMLFWATNVASMDSSYDTSGFDFSSFDTSGFGGFDGAFGGDAGGGGGDGGGGGGGGDGGGDGGG